MDGPGVELVGRVLEQRYRVLQRLAGGGMATVFAALDLRLDRTVALKVPHASLAADPEFLSRFIGEAKAAARLSHPHVVGVYDQGTTVLSADDAAPVGGPDADVEAAEKPTAPREHELVFLVMEYVEGRTLRDALHSGGAMSPARALEIFQGIASALAAAHGAGLVHRDVKPENVLLGKDGSVKVADFGLARAVGAGAASGEGLLLGTASYVSPEQMRTGTADQRSDVYSAGIVLYEMLTGQPPFTGDDAAVVAARHVDEDVPAPSESAPGVPAGIDQLVVGATRRDPAARPADGSALLAATQTLQRSLFPAGAFISTATEGMGAGAQPSGTDISSTTVLVPLPAAAADTNHRTMALPRMPQPGAGGTSSTGSSEAEGSGRPRLAKPLAVESAPAGAPGRQPPGWRGPAAVLFLATALALGVWLFGYGPFAYTAVPPLLNLTEAEARQKAEAAGFDVRFDRQFDETVPRGQVVSTNPAPGERLSRQGTITAVLSDGKERYDVPALAGRSLDDARRELQRVNLRLGEQKFEYSETVPGDRIISTRPRAGAAVRRDTPVEVTVSQGPPPIPVPQVIGRHIDDATRELQSLGLQVRTTSRNDPAAPAGAVVSQDIAPGTRVGPGRTIGLVVSEGPEVVIVPDVGNRGIPQAERTLREAGFQVRKSGTEVFGVVRSTEPDAGSPAPKGSIVILKTL